MTTVAGTRCPYCGHEPLGINQDRATLDRPEYVCNPFEGCTLFAQDLVGQTASTTADAIGRMRRLAEILDKPLRDCSIDDLKLGMAKLAEKNTKNGQYSSGTRRKLLLQMSA